MGPDTCVSCGGKHFGIPLSIIQSKTGSLSHIKYRGKHCQDCRDNFRAGGFRVFVEEKDS